MRVLHVPFTFYPDPAGGTEVYVEALARGQRAVNIDAFIAAPSQAEQYYEHEGLPVWRFPVSETVQDLREMYGEGDSTAAEAFAQILETAQPDLIHLHAFTRGVSLRLVRSAKQRGIPIVFSYHTPTVSCQRGTLLQWGTDVCDGVLDVEKCSQCMLHSLGLNRSASALAGLLPQTLGRALGAGGLAGGIWTALRMTELISLQHAAFRALMAEVDHVVALCQWVKELLLRNSVPEGKITISRQGLCQVDFSRSGPSGRQFGDRLRMIFLGRLDPTKGADILINAFRTAPEVAIDLDIYGVVQGEAGAAYLRKLKQCAEGDVRISFRDPVPARDVVSKMREYDLVAVPSQWLETGPMVVLEAFAAGVPVIGSDLGGIAELVTHGTDGLLVEPTAVADWANALRRISDHPALLGQLRSNIYPPRRISESARDMAELYQAILPQRTHA